MKKINDEERENEKSERLEFDENTLNLNNDSY